ncbi:multidrug efflux MFS transporter [Streptomonospora sp. PA3]|uniref:DHA2 family efflux MFS transporter permease subunit n=1 Tax=Streptomonospora sp. PA3 TaxID=2607326 RepID=UPI0012DD3B74|nr:DHA2 family efflux MFS transporter permease subunit [Streptomonospora sp. PA3]MUL41506.1 multidrug efflux MFS transporter [Streptomonospora sp. PA3]
MPTECGDSDRLDPSLIRLAATLMVGGLACLLNTTIVGVALDDARADLGADTAQIQWVATTYLLTLAIVVPTMPWALGRLGAGPLWRLSLVIFAVASLLCGAAWSTTSLVVFRILQGVGGGLILPLLQTILATAAGPRRLGRTMALVAVPGQLAPLAGPLLGGVLVDGPGWRWVFWISVPLSVAALALSWRGLQERVPADRHQLDVRGLLLFCPGLAMLLYGCTQITASAPVPLAWVPITAGTALLGAYVAHTRRSDRALMELRMFANPSFALAAGLMAVAGASIFGPMVLLPLFYQQARGATAAETGLLLAPLALATMAALPLAGRLTDRLGPRPVLLAGTAVASLATLPYVIVPETGDLGLSAALFARGAGLAFATVPITVAAYSRLAAEDIPGATALLSVIQRVGGSFGTALLLTVVGRQLAAGDSSLQAYGVAFGCTLVLSLVALVPAALLPRRANG